MGEALHTSPNEVQWKIHNLRNQVSNYFLYRTACIVWMNFLCVKYTINL
jgi:hypothetical protein